MSKKRRFATKLLEERVKQWAEAGCEEITFQPVDDCVCVWRLPSMSETKGGLYIPEEHRTPHVKGLVLGMGPRARDILYSNGIEEGHYVIFGRFAGWEANDSTPEEEREMRVLMIKARDIIGSDDLKKQLDSGQAKYVLGEDKRWYLERKLISGRKEKLLALAADPNAAPNERATAHKLAAKME